MKIGEEGGTNGGRTVATGGWCAVEDAEDCAIDCGAGNVELKVRVEAPSLSQLCVGKEKTKWD
ncbi:hypothetical protein U1Q18_037764 [Sarracenia purpurea var. burkii]